LPQLTSLHYFLVYLLLTVQLKGDKLSPFLMPFKSQIGIALLDSDPSFQVTLRPVNRFNVDPIDIAKNPPNKQTNMDYETDSVNGEIS
jgi:hypothetical protein